MPTFANAVATIEPTMGTPVSETTRAASFVDRRQNAAAAAAVERRQFVNSHDELSPDARELANAIDNYKASRRRRFITFEEMLTVMKSLGYHKA